MPASKKSKNTRSVTGWSAAGFVIGFVIGFTVFDSAVSGALLGIGLGFAMGAGKNTADKSKSGRQRK